MAFEYHVRIFAKSLSANADDMGVCGAMCFSYV